MGEEALEDGFGTGDLSQTARAQFAEAFAAQEGGLPELVIDDAWRASNAASVFEDVVPEVWRGAAVVPGAFLDLGETDDTEVNSGRGLFGRSLADLRMSLPALAAQPRVSEHRVGAVAAFEAVLGSGQATHGDVAQGVHVSDPASGMPPGLDRSVPLELSHFVVNSRCRAGALLEEVKDALTACQCDFSEEEWCLRAESHHNYVQSTFRVRFYSAASSATIVEFQRRAGDGVRFMHIFRSVQEAASRLAQASLSGLGLDEGAALLPPFSADEDEDAGCGGPICLSDMSAEAEVDLPDAALRCGWLDCESGPLLLAQPPVHPAACPPSPLVAGGGGPMQPVAAFAAAAAAAAAPAAPAPSSAEGSESPLHFVAHMLDSPFVDAQREGLRLLARLSDSRENCVALAEHCSVMAHVCKSLGSHDAESARTASAVAANIAEALFAGEGFHAQCPLREQLRSQCSRLASLMAETCCRQHQRQCARAVHAATRDESVRSYITPFGLVHQVAQAAQVSAGGADAGDGAGELVGDGLRHV